MRFQFPVSLTDFFRTERLRRAVLFQPLAVMLACLVAISTVSMPGYGQLVNSRFQPNYAPPVDPLGNTITQPPQGIQPYAYQLPFINFGSLISPKPVGQTYINYATTRPLYLQPSFSQPCTTAKNSDRVVQCSDFPNPWEVNAATTFVLNHGLPASDAAYIYQYGRSDLRNQFRGFMLSLILGIIKKNAALRTYDEQAVFDWLTIHVYNNERQLYTTANNEWQSFQKSSCNYNINQAVVSALGLNSNSWTQCGGGDAGIALSGGSYPPLAYFEAVGHSAAYGQPLGTAGTQALTQAQQELLHSTFVATQAAGNSTAVYSAYVAGVGAGVPAVAVASNFSEIAPFRGRAYFRPAGANFRPVPASETAYTTGTNQLSSEIAETTADPEVTEAVSAESVALAEEPAADAVAVTADAVGTATGIASAASAGAAVVAIALFAIEAAVTDGISAFSNEQNLNDDSTLPNLLSQIQNNDTVDLTQMIKTNDGFVKICETFIQATLPDYPSTATVPAGSIPEDFYFIRTAGSTSTGNTSTLAYDGADGNTWEAHLWNGWLVQQPTTGPNAGHISFGLDFNYVDQNKVNRRATRLAPNLFEIEPQQYDSNAPFCAVDPSLGITNPSQVNVDNCESAVFDSVKMTFSGGPLTTFIALPPIINTNPTITAAQGQRFSYQPTLTSRDPLNLVPCSATISGSLPVYVKNSGGALTSISPYQYSTGTYPLTVTGTCGGASLQESVSLVAGSQISFNTSLFFALPIGFPFSRTVTTTSYPAASLSIQGTLPPGVTFTDHHNGTGTLSGTPSATFTSCSYPDCPVLVANNGTTSANGTLTFYDTYNAPVFASPASGSSVQVLTADSIANDPLNAITIKMAANTAPVKLTASLPQGAGTFSFTDNGNNSGTLVFNNPNPISTSVPVSITATPCCGLSSISETFTVQEVPAPLGLTGTLNGPAAFIVGQATNPTLPVTLTTNLQALGSNGLYSHSLPAGLGTTATTSKGNSAVTITGTPGIGTGGIYHIPLSVFNGGNNANTSFDLVVYESPSFPTYNASNSVVFRIGTPSYFTVSPVSGFPIGPFSDGVLGSSAGLTYALSPSLSSLSGTPFSLEAGLAGASNGTLNIDYNGQALSSGSQFTLPLVAAVTTGLVPNYSGPNNTGTYSSTTYTNQTAFNVDIYVALPGDADLDGHVTCKDLQLVQRSLNFTSQSVGWSPTIDQNGDGKINLQDLLIVSKHLPAGTHCQ